MAGDRKQHLELIWSQSQEELEQHRRLDEVRTREFTAGSFQRAVDRSDNLFHRHFSVDGHPTLSDAKTFSQDAIVNALEEHKAILKGEDFNADKLRDWSIRIMVNRLAPEVAAKYGLVPKDPYMPENNLQRVWEEYRDYLWQFAGRGLSREAIEDSLESRGVHIYDPDVTRLIVHGMNRSRFYPQVLVIPNRRKPYNPSFAKLQVDQPLPDTTRHMLNILGR